MDAEKKKFLWVVDSEAFEEAAEKFMAKPEGTRLLFCKAAGIKATKGNTTQWIRSTRSSLKNGSGRIRESIVDNLKTIGIDTSWASETNAPKKETTSEKTVKTHQEQFEFPDRKEHLLEQILDELKEIHSLLDEDDVPSELFR